MKSIISSIIFLSLVLADNQFCTLPNPDTDEDYSSLITSREYYNIGDTISEEDQEHPYSVCHSDGYSDVGSTFSFSDYSGDIILISMNATW